MNKAFVLGSLNMDFIISVDNMPKIGETLQGKGFQTSPGGKGSNQAVALAKQEVETYMIGSVGDDMIGKQINQSLTEYGVYHDYVQVLDHQTSGIAMIILEGDDNRIITSAGANAHHKINDINNILSDHSNQNDLFLVQLEIPLNIIEQSLIIAKGLGMKTVLNAAPIKDLSQHLLKNVDLLIVNETEAERLIGSNISNHQIDDVLTKLKQLGPEEIIITLGKNGSYYSNSKQLIFTSAYEVDHVIDTTGAGDAFIGSFLAQRLNGQSIKASLVFASAAGAITVTKKGVHHAIPSKKDMTDFIQKRGRKNA